MTTNERAGRIESLLREALGPSHLTIENESHKHNVPKGSQTHFKVVVVSSKFDGVSAVKRHQLVYQALAPVMTGPGKLHALAITARTESEWAASPEGNVSPPCMGGSKADAQP